MVGRELASSTTRCREGADGLRRGDYLGHVTALGVALKPFETLEPKAATAGRKPLSQSDYASSLPMGIVDFSRRSCVPRAPGLLPNLPATCGAQVSSHCRPVAFLCSSRASSLFSRQPSARQVANQGWEAGVCWSNCGYHRLQLWCTGAEMTPRASVTQAVWTQNGSAQSCSCPVAGLGTESQPPTPQG